MPGGCSATEMLAERLRTSSAKRRSWTDKQRSTFSKRFSSKNDAFQLVADPGHWADKCGANACSTAIFVGVPIVKMPSAVSILGAE